MNAMIDEEGKLIQDTLSNQKLYNKLKGQAAILMRDLNKELKDNDHILINEKSSIDDITKAMNELTTSMMNNALVSGFEKQLQKISEKSADASVAILKLADEMNGYSMESIAAQNKIGAEAFAASGGEIGDPLEGTRRAIKALISHYNESKSMYNDLVAEHGEKNVPKGRTFHEIDKLLKSTGFKSLDEINKALNGTEKEIAAVTIAFDSLAGEGGIGGLLLKTDELEEKTDKGDLTEGLKSWSLETKIAINEVKKSLMDGVITEEEYKDKVLEARNKVLEREKKRIKKIM